jgi:hypothetical protein
MAIIPQRPLFDWQQIEADSDINRLMLVLSALPDEQLMRALEKLRDKGRDDYPVRASWNALIAGIVYQHPNAASLLRELRRNAQLRQACGFDLSMGAKAVPSDDAFGRFLSAVIGQQPLVLKMFDVLVGQLGEILPDLGKKLAADSKAIQSAGKPQKKSAEAEPTDDQPAEPAKTPAVEPQADLEQETDRRRENDADWGVKSYHGKRADGTMWKKLVTWFGFKLHLLVDSTYEMPLAFKLTKASRSDSPELLPLVEQLKIKHPVISARGQELAADKGYDAAENKAGLLDIYGMKPLIDHRLMWKEDPEKARSLFPDLADVFLYDEMGNVFCQCPTEQKGKDEVRPMAFVGFEKDRRALKYQCPAAYAGFKCIGRAQCEKLAPLGVGSNGRILRVPLERDRRIFTPIARHTHKWKKAYDCRTAVERVNSRIDRVLGFEQHTIRGLAKMETRVTLALVVTLAMAVGRIKANQADLMRSMTAPVRRAA